VRGTCGDAGLLASAGARGKTTRIDIRILAAEHITSFRRIFMRRQLLSATSPSLSAAFLLIVFCGSAARSDTPPLPDLEKSDIVVKSADGSLGVARKDGKPFDGFKLSQHDSSVITPNIAASSDGTLHVAFNERQEISPYNDFVYYRQSTDGGKTWSEAKNLSEVSVAKVGGCKLLIDGKDRVYVIWPNSLEDSLGPSQGSCVNLVYRVMDHGKWSKILPIHPPGSADKQNVGSIFSFATVDPNGNAQVVWNANPTAYLPVGKVTSSNGMPLAGVGNGLVFQAMLDGTTPSAPKQVYMAKITADPGNPEYSKSCDGFSCLDGYIDAKGAPHFVAIVTGSRITDSGTHIELVEDGKQTPLFKLPDLNYMVTWSTPPKLLVDAKGRRHVIAKYIGGERPAFRDYTVGSDEDAVEILKAKAPGGTCMGFQAWQGPAGRMAVVMQTTDAGTNDAGDSWLSVSDGDKWSTPICITNNAARSTFASKNTGAIGSVTTMSHYGPGEGCVAFNKEGHLLLTIVNVETGSFGLAAGGTVYTSGSTSKPMLFFYKFQPQR
jgi:hypothetical protein